MEYCVCLSFVLLKLTILSITCRTNHWSWSWKWSDASLSSLKHHISDAQNYDTKEKDETKILHAKSWSIATEVGISKGRYK